MTWPTSLAMARWSRWACLLLNVGVIAGDVTIHRYTAAALQSVIVVFIVALMWLAPKVEQLLDANLETAIAQRATAVIQHEVAETMRCVAHRAARSTNIRVDVTGGHMN